MDIITWCKLFYQITASKMNNIRDFICNSEEDTLVQKLQLIKGTKKINKEKF